MSVLHHESILENLAETIYEELVTTNFKDLEASDELLVYEIACINAQQRSTTVTSLPLYLPGKIDPPYINTDGIFNLTIDIINPGKDLSHPAKPTIAS